MAQRFRTLNSGETAGVAERVRFIPSQPEAEALARLAHLRDMLEHEAQALRRLADERLLDVLVEIEETRLALHNALQTFKANFGETVELSLVATPPK